MPVDRILYENDDCAIALCGDVMIQIWEGPAHNSVLQLLLGFFQSLKNDEFRTRKLYVLHVVGKTASPPDAEGRAIAAKFLGFFEFHANATEGAGFRASLIRSALVGIAFLSRTRTKHAVTASVLDAAKALVAAGCTAAATDLVSSVATLRRSMRVRGGACRPTHGPIRRDPTIAGGAPHLR